MDEVPFTQVQSPQSEKVKHMKLTHTYVVQKGDEVPATFHGTEVPVTEYDNSAEALAAGHFENDRALIAAAYAQRRIKQNIAVRARLASEGGTVAQAITDAEAVVYKAPRVSDGTPKARKGSGEIVKAKAVASRVTNATVELVRGGDERKIKQAIALGFVTQEDIDAARASLAAETVTQA